MTTTDIQPGQVWRSTARTLTIKAISARPSSRRQGALWVTHDDGSSARMTKAWLRHHYQLAGESDGT